MKSHAPWPILDFHKIKDTLETLHQYIQIVGKVRLKTMPWQNHSWHTTLYVTTAGFSTHSIPYKGRAFQIDFDFKSHKLIVSCSNQASVSMDLGTGSIADFYYEVFALLLSIDVDVKIHQRPNEMDPAVPFPENNAKAKYDPSAAHDIWQAMLRANEVFSQFRSEFIGKVSPVHLFWGAFDLAVTRFSGNPAPLHGGGMPNMPLDVMQEAYSKELSSAGFWPGSADFPTPIFYSYVYPSNPDYLNQKVRPDQAFYGKDLGEFVLKYDDVRSAPNPEETLHDFLQSTYEAAANTGNWERSKLEREKR